MINPAQARVSSSSRAEQVVTKNVTWEKGKPTDGGFADILAKSTAKAPESKPETSVSKKPEQKPEEQNNQETSKAEGNEQQKPQDQVGQGEEGKSTEAEQNNDAAAALYASQVAGLLLNVPVINTEVKEMVQPAVVSEQAEASVDMAVTAQTVAAPVDVKGDKILTDTPVAVYQNEPVKTQKTEVPVHQGETSGKTEIASGKIESTVIQTQGQKGNEEHSGHLSGKNGHEVFSAIDEGGDQNSDQAVGQFTQVLKDEVNPATIKVNDSASLLQKQVSQQVSDQIVGQFKNGNQQFTMTLHPERLGQVAVKLAFEGGQVVVHVETHNQLAQSLLAGNIAELKGLLQNNGVQAVEVHVSQFAGDGQTGYEGSKHSQSDEQQKQAQQGNRMDNETFGDEIEQMAAEGGLDYSI